MSRPPKALALALTEPLRDDVGFDTGHVVVRPISFVHYARAQVRESEVRDRCKDACKDCPGPDAPDGCLTRRFPTVVAGRADWPMCPLGMLRNETWNEVCEVFVASKYAPSAVRPERQSAWVRDALNHLYAAIRREDDARAKASTKPSTANLWGRREPPGAG